MSTGLFLGSAFVLAQEEKPIVSTTKSKREISQELVNSRINDAVNVKNDKSSTADNAVLSSALAGSRNNEPDVAYGAFQRGYYLTAFKLALPRAQLGDPAAQTLIAVLYESGLGIKRDMNEATQWYKFAAENGSREAQFSYALKLLEGKYVSKDKNAARGLLKKSADAGHSAAQFNYAQMVVDERPTARGFEIALGYYEKAAANGVADAYFAISQIYARGYGVVTPNEKAAREILIKAALNHVENAQIELAIWLANGRGGEKDLNGALAWFRIAAIGGNVIAQNRLARMYALGLGTDVKPDEAAKWYVLARRRGHKDAMLDDFFNSLAPEVRKVALKAANNWHPRAKPKWQISEVKLRQ